MIVRKIVIAGMLTAALAVPAISQTAQFYVVQDTKSKKCTIVAKKPTTTTMLVVGDTVFKTRAEAQTGMKSITVCK